MWEIFVFRGAVIPNEHEESPTICLRFFSSLRFVQNDILSGDSSGFHPSEWHHTARAATLCQSKRMWEIPMSSRTRHRRCEGSHTITLAWREILHVSFRMTTMSFRVHTRNPQPYVQWSGILHFTAFRSEWYDCHSERMWGISAVISNASERSHANTRLAGDSSGLHPSEWQHTTKAALLGRGFFPSTVVEMTTKIPRIIEKRRYLLSHKK